MSALKIKSSTETCIDWDYTPASPGIQRLRDAARQSHWDSDGAVNWDLPNSAMVPDERTLLSRAALENSPLSRFGAGVWQLFRKEQQSWMVSQFLHGEQSAMVVCARLTEILPDMSAKAFAATQAAEEAHHAAVFLRYEKMRGLHRYSASASFEELLSQMLRDRHWDVQALGMQIMIESLAWATFRIAAGTFDDPLIRTITQLIARDETRHISFGVLLLDGLYETMDEAERRYREDFVLEAAELLSRRYLMTEVWERLGIDVREGSEFARSNTMMCGYRCAIFAKVVQTLKQVGLMSARVRDGFDQLGLIGIRELTRSAVVT
jgi:hypothetical protein